MKKYVFLLAVCGYFIFSQHLALSQEAPNLKEAFVRLLLSEKIGDPSVPFLERVQNVCNSSLWRNPMWKPFSAEKIDAAIREVKDFLKKDLYSLLIQREEIRQMSSAERKAYFEEQLDMTLSDAEIEKIRDIAEPYLRQSGGNFNITIDPLLSTWRANLSWTSQVSGWKTLTLHIELNIEGLRGMIEAIEWGPLLPDQWTGRRMGFNRVFTLVRSEDGGIKILYVPQDDNLIKIFNPAYVEIVGYNTKISFQAFQDRHLGPYVAEFTPAIMGLGSQVRFVTLKFSNPQGDFLPGLHTVVDLVTGVVFPFNGRAASLFQEEELVRQALSHRESPLWRQLIVTLEKNGRGDLVKEFLGHDSLPLVEKELAFDNGGSLKLTLQQFDFGNRMWLGEALEFVIDKPTLSKLLYSTVRDVSSHAIR